MKRIIILIFCVAFIPLFANANAVINKIYAVSTNEHSTAELCSRNKQISVRTLDTYNVTKTLAVEKNSDLILEVQEYINPKRGKMNGYLKIKLLKHSIPSKDDIYEDDSDKNIKGTLRLSEKKDKKELAKTVGISVTGHILKVPGFSQAVALSKGLIKPNPEQTRLQSAGHNLYKSTPLTYVEKGNDLSIEKDAIIVLHIKNNQ